METNYELKHKCLLVPLKVVLLVIAMVLVGFTTYAQQGKSVKVANDQQLIEAIENPSIVTIELAPGYYAFLNIQATASTTVVKQQKGDGNRSSSGCTYTIRGENWCYRPSDIHYPPNPPGGAPMVGYSYGQAQADVINTTCLSFPVPCCPTDGSGVWSVTLKPVGAADPVFYNPNDYLMDFWVNKPGKYKFKYTWDPAVNPLLTEFAEVETEYNFYGPAELSFTAPDVCGTTTLLDFVFLPGYDPAGTHTIQWFYDLYPYGDPVAITGPTATVNDYPFTIPDCGIAIITVKYNAFTDCFTEFSDTVEFSCEPTADAGDDVNVCDDLCYYSLLGSTGLYTYSPSHNWAWIQLEGPGTLVFNNPTGLETGVCAEDPVCAYGEYEVQFQVQNGLCSDEDEMFLRFYEQPDANAGPNQNLCSDFTFNLAAVPYVYCGVNGVNYWSTSYWEIVSQADPTAVVTFSDINDPNASVTITYTSDCPYGLYEFKWVEENSKGLDLGGCFDEDNVVVAINENPLPDAGDDQSFCNTFEFYLDGTDDAPCTQSTAYTTHWELVSQPGDCDVTITPDVIDPFVTITNCDPCQYGEYVFKLTQSNGYNGDAGAFVDVCTAYDLVSVWIFEQPVDVYAGDDQLLCNDFAFSLLATGAEYCGDYGVNYFNAYSWVLVSQPEGADCDVTIESAYSLLTNVTVAPCIGECTYGEYVFRFTETNGNDDAYCYDWDEVTVTIFEQPLADAGDDVDACVDLAFSPFCYPMTGTLEYCYTMVGVWTKSCGPGDVIFRDVNDPATEICIEEPGHYVFTWTVETPAEDCGDFDEVVFNILEQPVAIGGDSELTAPCDELCIDLGLAEITKYEYFGTDAGECPNFNDLANWSLIMGPDGTDPLQVVFADDTDPATEMCVSWYGAYTVRWTEVNKAVDSDFECSDFFDVYVEFYETPEPFAGDDDVVCGSCYTLQGVQYSYLPLPNQHQDDYYYWESLSTNPCAVTFSDFESLTPQVCIPDAFECYGTYGFVLHESNGDCFGSDTVYICFSDVPDDVAVCFWNDPNDCGEFEDYNQPDFIYSGCLEPNDVLEVCAEGVTNIEISPWCYCPSWFDFSNPDYYGYTFEWSLISPAGTITESQAGYYDYESGYWVYPYIYIQWGECCDTARLYLTITGPEGDCDLTCENTMEYKFYVHHKPCANIEGPDVSEVGTVTTYCNVCPPEFDQSCLLYNWTAEPCGEIVSGQGTECIEVLWTDYNINGGWGQITLTVFDTCTGCCNYDEMMVKIWPTGTVGDATLAGHVYYQNNYLTPLNGVEIQLWNGGIPVMSTTSFVDIEGGNGVGYYEFVGVNGVTDFGITASYDAPWYGANATDALAVELFTISSPIFPAWFVNQPLQEEAMNVNDNASITATDALWIKQRAINMVNYFPAGNWVFEPGMSSTAGTYNIYTLNAGDANRSNVPNSGKSMPAIDLLSDGTMNVVTGQVFELPIRIAKANQFGAITLNLGFNSALVEVVEVVSQEGMLDNITDGNVSIAWSNVNPMALTENDVVVTLKVKAISEISSTESLFSIGMGSEFADQSANVIEPVTLKTFGVTTGPAAADYFLSTNRPNPFSTSTFIEYTMPETGKVKLSVLDMLGQEIAVLVESTQTAGSYTVEFSAAGLATGVYLYKITVDGETRDFISTQRMVISH